MKDDRQYGETQDPKLRRKLESLCGANKPPSDAMLDTITNLADALELVTAELSRAYEHPDYESMRTQHGLTQAHMESQIAAARGMIFFYQKDARRKA